MKLNQLHGFKDITLHLHRLVKHDTSMGKESIVNEKKRKKLGSTSIKRG